MIDGTEITTEEILGSFVMKPNNNISGTDGFVMNAWQISLAGIRDWNLSLILINFIRTALQTDTILQKNIFRGLFHKNYKSTSYKFVSYQLIITSTCILCFTRILYPFVITSNISYKLQAILQAGACALHFACLYASLCLRNR